MIRKPTATPDTILAHVRVLRLTDELLGVAENLREARDSLQSLLDHPAPTTDKMCERPAEQQPEVLA